MKMKTFTTTDLAAAAYLYYRGCALLRVIHGTPFSAYQFNDEDGSATAAIEEWNLGNPTGELKAYAVAMLKVRSMLRRAA
jgi:hypothetical protein